MKHFIRLSDDLGQVDEQIDLLLMIQLVIKFLPQIGIDALQAHLVAAVALQKHRVHGFQPGVLPRSVPQDARRQKFEVHGQAGGLKAFFLKGAVIGIADDLLDRLDELYGIVGQRAVRRTGYQMQGNVARFVLRQLYAAELPDKFQCPLRPTAYSFGYSIRVSESTRLGRKVPFSTRSSAKLM